MCGKRLAPSACALLLGLLLATPAQAALEVEVDPLAYALDGYSAHVILAGERFRTDFGVFALKLPDDSRNPHYTAYFEGYGIKVDYNGSAIDGAFWGAEYARSTITFDFDDPGDGLPKERTERNIQQVGLRVGYRFGKDGFYVTPWIGVARGPLSEPVRLGGQEYQHNEYTVFPTVHLGYRF